MPPPSRTPTEIAADQRSFQDVRRVLAGELRVPVDVSAWKMLRLMLHESAGCDVRLSSHELQVRYAWNPGPHRYHLDVAPACVSQLLAWSGVTLVDGELRVRIPATTVRWKSTPTWSFPDQQWWVRVEDEQVTMCLRAGLSSLVALPWPTLIEPGNRDRRWRELDPAQPCPHCQRPVARARDLGDVLVCPHCARSYVAP